MGELKDGSGPFDPPNAVPPPLRWLQTATARAEAGLASLHGQLTPGQRWTAGLASLLAVALLVLGQPAVRVAAPAATAAPRAPGETASGPVASEAGPASDAPAEPSDGQQIALPPPLRTGGVQPQGPSTSSGSSGSTSTPEPDGGATGPVPGGSSGEPSAPSGPPPVPIFSALVPAAGDAAVPGHTEADVAGAFFDQATINGTVVTYDPAAQDHADACAEATRREVVLAVTLLPADLRDCVLAAGALIVAHDERGAVGQLDGEQAALVSTRLPITDVLQEAAAWGAGGALDGAVGLAIDPRLRGQVEPVVPVLEAAGIDVVAVAYVEDVRASVLAFSQAGVEVTVFALPVAQQREWTQLAGLLGPTTSYVVLDAADAVTSGDGYAPTFDGARALSAALPTATPTDEQQGCYDRWEQTSGAPTLAAERFAVLGWCQLSDLLDEVVATVRTGGGAFRELLAAARFTSPLTTPLGPRPDGGWGPAQLRERTWSADCGCWS